MFQRLVRRISTSFFPRPDRPWNDDATSTAPTVQIGTKRRFNEEDEDEDETMPPPSAPGTPTTPGTPRKELAYGSVMKKQKVQMESNEHEVNPDDGKETQDYAIVEEGVKKVTQGVKEVEITPLAAVDGKQADAAGAVARKAEDPAEVAEDHVEAAETTAAAAVPLPESPVLRAKEPEIVETEIDVPSTEKMAAESEAPASTGSKETTEVTGVTATTESAEKVTDEGEVEVPAETKVKEVVDLTDGVPSAQS